MENARAQRLAGDPVTLEAVLAAREARAQRQRDYAPGRALMCLTVNMPGPVKRNQVSCRVFLAGLAALRTGLGQKAEDALVLQDLDTGPEAYLRLSCVAAEAKAIACAVEDGRPWGRLLDADVLTPGGAHVSRQELGRCARGCFVCGAQGMGCARSRAHGLDDLYKAVLDMTDCLFEGEA